MVNSSMDGILFQIRRWSRIAFSSDGLTFLNVKGEISISSPDLTSMCLSISSQADFVQILKQLCKSC